MFKYVKFNEDSGLCTEVGMGTNTEFYKTHGFVRKDVEQSEVDGQWYLIEKCPHYTPEEKEQQEQTKRDEKAKAELESTIAEIRDDMMTAIAVNDDEWLEELRSEYAAIINGEE